MSIIAWIVLGLITGLIAKSLLGGSAQHGMIVTIVIGIAGALLGGWAASTFFGIKATREFFDLSTWIIAIMGSMVLLLIYHATTSGSHPESPGTQSTRIMTNFEPDPDPGAYSNPNPGLVGLTPAGRGRGARTATVEADPHGHSPLRTIRPAPATEVCGAAAQVHRSHLAEMRGQAIDAAHPALPGL